MKTLLPALLVCVSGFVSTLAVTADSPGVSPGRAENPWLWSTGDFAPDRALTSDDVPGKADPDASDAA